MKKFPIALQAYSLREEMAADFEGTLALIAKMGYDGVEFAGLFGRDPKEVKEYLAKIGLIPVSAHVSLEEMMSDPATVLSDYGILGCRYIAIPYLTEEKRPGGSDFATTLAAICMLGALAAKKGMQLLYHNHDFEFQKVEDEYLLDRLYSQITPMELATELDVCWVSVGGENPAAYVEKYTGRAPVVHLKNYVGGKTDHMYDLIGIHSETTPAEERPFEMRSLGEGIVDIPAVLAAAEKADTRWVVVEQDVPTPGKTAVECAKESIEYLRSL